MTELTYSDLLERLRRIDDAVNRRFRERFSRDVGLAEKQQKIIEELGEVLKAQTRQEFIDEIWDSTIACFSQSFVAGFTNLEITQSLWRVLHKLDGRWGRKEHGRD